MKPLCCCKSGSRRASSKVSPHVSKDVKAVAEASSAVASSLYELLSAKVPETTNLVFSPFSFGALIAMLKLGARGSTAEQIVKYFYFPHTNEELIKGYGKIFAALDGSRAGPVVLTANSMFVHSGLSIKSEFTRDEKLLSGTADALKADFDHPPAAVTRINEYIERETQGKIKNLMNQDLLEKGKTRLLLVDGVYLKGIWQNVFQKAGKGKFNLNENDYVEVDMITTIDFFMYGFNKEMDAQVIALPYSGGWLSLVAFVPDTLTGLPRVVEVLRKTTTLKILKNCAQTHCQVYFPLFTLDSTVLLKESLEKMGVDKLFSPEADLSGIVDPKECHIFASQAIQRTRIQVTQFGTEAADSAAIITPVEFQDYQRKSEQPEMVGVNCPFLFQIVDMENATVIFEGRLMNPLEQ